jgi:PAS domain S-box-containing protein
LQTIPPLAQDGPGDVSYPSCQRITGYSPEEFMADPALLEGIVHPDDHKQVKRHLRGESPNPAPHTAEYRILSRTGEERWMEHICQPVYGVDQRWLGQRASNRDITDRKKAELELKERIEALEKQLSERGGKTKN